MRAVSISQLKASLSEYVGAVRSGEEILVTERGKPVARMLKVQGDAARDERRARLARQGILSLRRSKLGRLSLPPGTEPSGVLSALLEERAEGR